MSTEIEKIFNGTQGYNFEEHLFFTKKQGNRFEAAFTVIKLIEISIVQPEVALELGSRLGKYGPRLDDSEESVDFVRTLNELNEVFIELRGEGPVRHPSKVSSREEVLALSKGILSCHEARERKDFIVSHATAFVPKAA